MALRVAGVASLVPGILLPPTCASLENAMSLYDEMLHEVVGDLNFKAISGTDELGAYKRMEKFVSSDKDWVKMLVGEKAACLQRLTGQSYRFFSEIALEPENRVLWEPYMRWEVGRENVIWVKK
eukprot:CAMPEP_0116840080 /NCGR_PEP_ID=MMETSP0418-20121206/10134_1 /TAXON_ID=1158023 /ORGANISM="Astrosyne radiata, Strain 13vi08-1A" /LENGTH=123 /DNA_ID=CAMNT_0004470283 /DNA_START=347 /DNA_END=718 /DNA_ORIENTATION=+